jgi:hypothetical protein
MTSTERKRCRNPRCRLKLEEPTDNEHHAFCCKGCHESFYKHKCLVCERPLRNARRRYCAAPAKCYGLARTYPQKYQLPVYCRAGLAGPIESRDKTPTRPPHRCLREWFWTDEVDLELELQDQAGQVLARLEHNRGRYRLTRPRTFPILSWPDFDEAKHRAESMALAALSLDPATAARVAKDNATPNSMGPPLNRSWPADTGDAVLLDAGSHLTECAADTYLDPGPIPDSLQLTAEQRRAGWERYHAERRHKLAVTDSPAIVPAPDEATVSQETQHG